MVLFVLGVLPMLRILSFAWLAFTLASPLTTAQAASLSELLGLDEALEAPTSGDSFGGFLTGITSQGSVASNGSASIFVDGCTPPVFSGGSPIVSGSIGAPGVNVSINIDIDITFIGSGCQPVASACRFH